MSELFRKLNLKFWQELPAHKRPHSKCHRCKETTYSYHDGWWVCVNTACDIQMKWSHPDRKPPQGTSTDLHCWLCASRCRIYIHGTWHISAELCSDCYLRSCEFHRKKQAAYEEELREYGRQYKARELARQQRAEAERLRKDKEHQLDRALDEAVKAALPEIYARDLEDYRALRARTKAAFAKRRDHRKKAVVGSPHRPFSFGGQ
jgi:hypothetical protein